MTITLIDRLTISTNQKVDYILPLTAEERTRSRYLVEFNGQTFHLSLSRGTILQDGDLLGDDSGNLVVKIVAKPEPVLTITPKDHLTSLIKAAYHLGNRHVSLEVTADYLRLSPDPVLQSMLEHLGVNVVAETVPFYPETGAYHHHH
jgi:urease accessory protein